MAKSNAGGTITRSEVIARARHWLGAGLSYNQGHKAWDVNHGRQYRTDCSGLIDNAWHLNTDWNTDALATHAAKIANADMRPGDIFNNAQGPHDEHHVVLFVAWSGSGKFTYISFGTHGMREGHATLAHGDGDGTLCSHPVGHYRAYRYHNIVDDDGTKPTHPSQPGHLEVDGQFGPATVRRLQASLNKTGANPKLTVDGEFGPASKRALQARLNHTNPPVAIDGEIGPQTVRALQANVHAAADGEWGPATTRALQTALNQREL
jgi:hypothetical protein